MSIVVESVPEELRELLLGALEQHALILTFKGRYYAAVPEWEFKRWRVYRLEHDAAEYYVPFDCSSCTCPCFTARGECKHRIGIKYGRA